MKCPVCSDVRMREVEKDGILIDVCPDCKGVWLDRGELDKLMVGVKEFRQEYERESENRSYRNEAPPSQPRTGYEQSKSYDDKRKYDDDDHKHGNPGYGYPNHKKKRSVFDVFEDLF